MKKLILVSLSIISNVVGAIQLNDTTSLDISPYYYVKSSYIQTGGACIDKNPVSQFGLDLSLNYKDFSLYVGHFENWSMMRTIKDTYKIERGLTETEWYMGGFYSIDNFILGLIYEIDHYPFLASGNYWEQMLLPSIVYNFKQFLSSEYGTIKVKFDPYFYINNALRFDWRESVDYIYNIYTIYEKPVSTLFRLGAVQRNKTNGESGWGNIYGKVALNWNGFELYYQHWFQLDDKVYSDYNYELCHDTIGLGYTISF